MTSEPEPLQPQGAGRPAPVAIGIVGAAITVVGAVLGIVAFTAVDWFSGGSAKFSDVHHAIRQLGPTGTGLAKAYFGWLGWLLLAVAVVVALLANVPSPAASGLRALGVLVGIAGIVVTFFAIKFANGVDYSQFIKHARAGFYLALAGFLLTTIGSAIGPAIGARRSPAGTA